MAIGQIPKKAKLASLLNFKVKVITNDSSSFIGYLKSFDKYMNLVLSDCEEFKITKKSQIELKKLKMKRDKMINDIDSMSMDGDTSNKITISDENKIIKEEKRLLGLCVIRGEQIISVSVQDGPNQSVLNPETRLNKGKGIAKPLVSTKPSHTTAPTSSGRLSQPLRSGTNGPGTNGGGVSKPRTNRPGFRKN